MFDSELFDPDEYEDGVRVLVREQIQHECSCGSQSTTTADHKEWCAWRKKAEAYRLHAGDRVKAAADAAEKKAAKEALEPPPPKTYTQAEVDAILANAKKVA